MISVCQKCAGLYADPGELFCGKPCQCGGNVNDAKVEIARLSAEIARLSQQLAERAADSRRLDWLEKHRPWIHNAASGYTESFGPKSPYWGVAPKDKATIYGDTFRAAIDSSMAVK